MRDSGGMDNCGRRGEVRSDTGFVCLEGILLVELETIFQVEKVTGRDKLSL